MASIDFAKLAQAYAFLGNSLLAPMSQTSRIGLDPAFWEAFPDFGSAEVRDGAQGLARYASKAQKRADAGQRENVEYAHLFVGPPRPAVAPWETSHKEGGASVGFGRAAVDVRRVLAQMGLIVEGRSNQYADHMGIELLCLSELCRRAQGGSADALSAADAFLREHPASWSGEFASCIAEEAPEGYYAGVARVIDALLHWQASASL